jgi:hypothetical protein
MWENQLAVRRHFLPSEHKVVHLSKLGFPQSYPAILVISPDHGLEAHGTKSAESCTLI